MQTALFCPSVVDSASLHTVFIFSVRFFGGDEIIALSFKILSVPSENDCQRSGDERSRAFLNLLFGRGREATAVKKRDGD